MAGTVRAQGYQDRHKVPTRVPLKAWEMTSFFAIYSFNDYGDFLRKSYGLTLFPTGGKRTKASRKLLEKWSTSKRVEKVRVHEATANKLIDLGA